MFLANNLHSRLYMQIVCIYNPCVDLHIYLIILSRNWKSCNWIVIPLGCRLTLATRPAGPVRWMQRATVDYETTSTRTSAPWDSPSTVCPVTESTDYQSSSPPTWPSLTSASGSPTGSFLPKKKLPKEELGSHSTLQDLFTYGTLDDKLQRNASTMLTA